jgi:hypothetical protein
MAALFDDLLSQPERPPAPPKPTNRPSPVAQALDGPAPAAASQPAPRAPQAAAQAAEPAAPAAGADLFADLMTPAPAREVGFMESAGRTLGAAAIPVERTVGLAAAGFLQVVKPIAELADTIAPIFGVKSDLTTGLRAAQDKVFQASEANAAAMARMYNPQQGEEFDTAGQIVGGVASAPIEIVGGMGVQRGLERSADVVQEGGTLGEAALAGGVTGAANVAANLIPIKAGGAVGRTIERGLGRVLPGGARAGAITGGAATGAALGVAGDVGVTEASNLALPEGKQFERLQQEADPAVSAGLGAAFGALPGVMAPRRQAAAPAPAADQPPTPGTQGSAGAAGTDMATQRRERAGALPVPIELTKGQAERTFEQQRFERETANDPDLGQRLRENADEQNKRVIMNLETFEEMTGREETERGNAGRRIIDAVERKQDARKRAIREAYKEADESGETQVAVDYTPLRAYIEEQTPTTREKLAPILDAVDQQLDKNDPARSGEITIKALEDVRKMIRTNADFGTPNGAQGAELIRLIDQVTEGAGGELYQKARGLYREYAREFKNQGVVRDLLALKKNTSDRTVAFENVFKRSVLAADPQDLRNLKRTLFTAGDEGRQAWRELQGQALKYLREEATGNTARDSRGNPIVSADKFAKALRAIDKDGRLEDLVGKRGAQQLRDVDDLLKDIYTAPPGAVNTSNTASVLIKYLGDVGVSTITTGLPLPLINAAKAARDVMRNRQTRRQVEEALGGAADTGPTPAPRPRRFDEDPPEDPPEPPAPPPRPPKGPAPTPAARDPRIAEIDRLSRGASEETRKVLEQRRRAIETEIRDAEQQSRAAEEAEAMRDTARSTKDPTLAQELMKRAEELSPERIPTGDAVELPPATGQAPDLPAVPAGEAVDLTPDELAAWREENGLGVLDADRAMNVAAARRIDETAVQIASVQYAGSPRAFDRAISNILEGARNASQRADTDQRIDRPDEAAGRQEGGRDDGQGQGQAQPRPDDQGPAGAGDAPVQASREAGQVAKPEIPSTASLEKTERDIEARFSQRILMDPDAMFRAYEALPETRGGKIVNTDEARALSPDYNESNRTRALYAAAVHEPASWIAARQFERLLARPPQTGKVLVLGGGGGSGKTSSLEGIRPGFENDFDAILDTTLSSEKSAAARINQALDSGRSVEIVFTVRDPLESIVNGIIPRAARSGRTVPLAVAAKAHADAPQVVAKLIERFAEDDRVTFAFVDNTRGPGQARIAGVGEIPDFDYNGLDGRAKAAALKAYTEGAIDEAVLQGLVGRREAEAAARQRGAQSGGARAGGQPQPQRGQPLVGPAGASAEVTTERGLTVPVRYRVADIGDLVTSHTNDLKVDPRFPAELQPRDRTRDASEAQIARIENAINPALLAESAKASDGAPIVGGDSVVESGNARTIALRRAYGSGKADAYRQWLIDNAARFGLDPEQIRAVKNPVLVRQANGQYDRAEFARQANESAIAQLSETEQAASDAQRLPDLEGFITDDSGAINLSQSAAFVRDFMRLVVAPTERNAMMTADGNLSQRGVARIRNAVFAKAYGDADLVAMLTESTDANVKNILTGLQRAAPDVARVRELAESGARAPADFIPELVDAVRRFSQLRADGMTVDQSLAQAGMFGGGPSDRVVDIMRRLEADTRAPRRVAEMVQDMAMQLDAGGDPRQGALMEPGAAYRVDQTQAPAFRRWFGDSKVVDADGKPLVVYHGTGNDFSTFMPSDGGEYGAGIYLTPDARGASDYAKYRGRIAPNVMPVYVRITNPAGPGEAANIGSWKGEESIRPELIRRGYDGIVDKFSGQIVAFHPEQIKSAIGNRGAFDPNDPSIVNESRARYGEPGLLADDLDAQQRFLQARARAAGFRGLDDFATGDFEGFMRAAEQWRERNPAAELREPGDDLLAPYGESDLRAKTEREARALAAEAAEQRRREEKARADAMVDDFQLTGSDRAADAAGQGNLFEPAAPYGTAAFDRWFGDSKVVDEDGKPRVVYHGAPADGGIAEFKMDGGAAYFTSDRKVAEGYTARRGLWASQPTGDVIAAHLSLQNPLVVDALGKRNDNIPVPWQEWKPKTFGNLPRDAVNMGKLVEYAKAQGHDGVIVRNLVDTADAQDRRKSDVFAAFAPAQIKSATGNRGTFDPADPDITREPDAPYTVDLFGEDLPQALRRQRPARAAAAAPETLGDTPAPAGDYLARTLIGSEVRRPLGAPKITTPAQAAAATRYLYRSAVERLDGIVVDKKGKPLAVVGGFKGALSQASVFPATMLAEAVRVPGAAAIWFSHNHPSGTARLSRADEALANSLADVFRGSGIEPRGLLAVAGDRYAFVAPGQAYPDNNLVAPAAAMAPTSVPAIERELVDQRDPAGKIALDSPREAKDAALRFYQQSGNKPGIMLTDAQNTVVAWVPLAPQMMGALRGTGGYNAVLRAVSEANAGAAVLVHGGELDQRINGSAALPTISQNIGAALGKSDVRLLDSINVKTGESAAERGVNLVSSQLLGAAGTATAAAIAAAAQQDEEDQL